MEKIFFETSDGVRIAANYFPVDKSRYPEPLGWAIFAHMMPAVKESWNELAKMMQNNGYEGIAVDLRGHGESQGGTGGFRTFSPAEHQKSIMDIAAAAALLEKHGSSPDKTVLIGASIGANLSLQYMAEHTEVRTAVLFSPGLDYHGIRTEKMAGKLKAGQKILFIGSDDDDGNSEEIKQLITRLPDGVIKKNVLYENGGHGTDILKKHPETEDAILNFLKRQN